jgi:hypothetical protein
MTKRSSLAIAERKSFRLEQVLTEGLEFVVFPGSMKPLARCSMPNARVLRAIRSKEVEFQGPVNDMKGGSLKRE